MRLHQGAINILPLPTLHYTGTPVLYTNISMLYRLNLSEYKDRLYKYTCQI